jgi:hypothetical protein
MPSHSPSVIPSSTPSADPSSIPSTGPSVSPSTRTTLQPSISPKIDCTDVIDFGFEGNSLRTCESYVALKTSKRCRKIQPESGG